jgi:hypothetical protein
MARGITGNGNSQLTSSLQGAKFKVGGEVDQEEPERWLAVALVVGNYWKIRGMAED